MNEEQVRSAEFLTYLINRHFQQVFDKDFGNIDLLFFILEEELKRADPELFAHIQNVELRLDSFLTTQYFTLFTLCLDFKQKSNLGLIRDIMDIFISESWLGLIHFTVCLILKHRANLLTLNMEEALLYFSKLFQNHSILNVPKLTESQDCSEGSQKDIKEQVREYKQGFYTFEYYKYVYGFIGRER